MTGTRTRVCICIYIDGHVHRRECVHSSVSSSATQLRERPVYIRYGEAIGAPWMVIVDSVVVKEWVVLYNSVYCSSFARS